MAFFSSRRERRLWLWTLAVVAAIYSTLGLANTLAWALRERGLLDVASFWLGMLLVGATIVAFGLKARPGGLEIAVMLGVTAAYVLLLLRMVIPEERSHLIEYGVVGVFIYAALAERASQGRRVPLPPLLAIVATAALGLFDEGIQGGSAQPRLRPNRHPVQPARGRDVGGYERRAGVGAAVVATPRPSVSGMSAITLCAARGRPSALCSASPS